MKILIVCQTMSYLSGSPLYHYTLALELKRQGHEVSIYSIWSENKMKNDLLKAGITIFYDKPSGSYDRIIISQPDYKEVLDNVNAFKVINVIHSEYDCETPITDKKIDEYIAIRPQIKEHLIKFHNIPSEKIRVVYNGIDFNRFSPEKRVKNCEKYVKVVIPCTMDMLRKKFIEYYIRKANEKYRVFFIGKDFGIKNEIYKNKWVYWHDEVDDIENYIADADFVAGILLGRVNLEARAMGILSYIHDPVNPENFQEFYPEDGEFNERHNIINVAKQILL